MLGLLDSYCTFYLETKNDSKNIQQTPKVTITWEIVYTMFKKQHIFRKIIYKMQFLSTRDTDIQSFPYKILYTTLSCNEWLKTSK